MKEKKCTKCGELKGFDEFSNDKNGKYGKSCHCKSCVKFNQKKYWEKNRKKNKIVQDGYFLRKKKCYNCKEIKLFSEFHSRKTGSDGRTSLCKECVKEKSISYRKENKEAIAKRKSEYGKKNRKKFYESRKEYRDKNREKSIEYSRKYYKENRTKCLKVNGEYRKKNRNDLTKKLREYRKVVAKYSTYAERLTISEDPKEGINDGLLVKCSKCREYFYALNGQTEDRIKALVGLNNSENRMYCSDSCKNECDVFRARATPKSLRNAANKSRCDQKTNRKALLDNQLDEYGYNFCERCGKEFRQKDLHIHHGILVSNDYGEASNMAHQVIVCKEHHIELHKGCK